MAESATTRSEILEAEYETSVRFFIGAAVGLVVSLALWKCFDLISYSYQQNHTSTMYSVVRPLVLVTMIFGALGTVALASIGATRMRRAKSDPSVTVRCPYCDFPMAFPKEPTLDWDCEGCQRRVQYAHGQMVEIKQITCAFCKTVHKVSANATTYMCDVCNRPLRLTDPKGRPTVTAPDESDLLRNYDVLLTEVGRNRNEVAMALESILICNLPEARRQMENLPLTVVRNVPERKADAIRRRLRDLGATAVTRPTST